MMVYSTKEKKTSIIQANSHTSMAVTALDTGILALINNSNKYGVQVDGTNVPEEKYLFRIFEIKFLLYWN